MHTRHDHDMIELRNFVDLGDDDRKFVYRRNGPPGNSAFEVRITNEAELALYNRAPILFNFGSLEDGDIDITLSGISTRWFGVWRLTTRSGFRATASDSALEDVALVQMTLKGRASHRGLTGEHVAEAGFGFIRSFRDIHDCSISPGYESINCVLRMKPLLQQMHQMNEENDTLSHDFHPLTELNTPALRSFQQNLQTIFDRVVMSGEGASFADPLVEEILIGQLLGSWPRKATQTTPPRPASSRHIQRSLDFIEAHLAVPISVAEVATAAGVGVRALQSSFRKDLGRTPIQYIIDRRLEKVHDELQRGGSTSISSVASRWGFVHMSDFSRRYRQRFGCTPSETQIRAGHGNP